MLLKPNNHPVNRDGLVGWWNYRNTGSVSALGTWNDYAGTGNDAPFINGTFVDNQGMNTNGSFEYGRIPDADNLDGFSNFTISLWAKPTSISIQPMLVSKRTSIAEPPYYIRVMSSGKIRFSTSNASYRVWDTDSSHVSNGAWVYITVTFNGSEDMKIYVNGVNVAKSIAFTSGASYTNIVANTDDLIIGGYDLSSFFYNGVMDDITIYNRTLSANEIKLNYLKSMRA